MKEVLASVDPRVVGWCEFEGRDVVTKNEEVVEGLFLCSRCGQDNIRLDELWRHVRNNHYPEIVREWELIHRGYNCDINEDCLFLVKNEEEVWECGITPNFDEKIVSKTGMNFKKKITGVAEEKLGVAIQREIGKVDLMPDVIEIKGMKSGRYSFRFGYEE